MKKLMALIVAALFLAGCTVVHKHNPPRAKVIQKRTVIIERR